MNQSKALQEAYTDYLKRNPEVDMWLEISSANPSRVDLGFMALKRLQMDGPMIQADADQREATK